MLIDFHTDAAHVNAERCHQKQRIATLEGDNASLRLQLAESQTEVALLQSQLATMQEAFCGMTESYAFYYEQFCDKCKEAQR